MNSGRLLRASLFPLLVGLLAACGDDDDSAQPAGGSGAGGVAGQGGSGGQAGDAGQGGAGGDAGQGGSGGSVDKAAACASTFGQELPEGFGRFDGTVVAVVPPAHPTCAVPNSTHIVVQIQAKGAVYRMVIRAIASEGTERRMFTTEATAPLPGEPWAEGWHGGSIDYVEAFGLHTDAFVPHEKDEVTAWVTDALEIGASVSVYATVEEKHDSAHLVHRNGSNHDGAVVIKPQGDAPRWLLFRFGDQSF